MSEHTELKHKLARAKTQLILRFPFIANIALNMDFLIDDTINPPTACTNGEYVKFHPEFCKTLTPDNIIFLVAHEVFHPMLMHLTRINGRDPKVWNMAGDYVINQLLSDDKVGDFIQGGLLDKKIHDAGGGTTDGIYKYLEENPDQQPQNMGGAGQDIVYHDGTDAQKAETEATMKVKIASAANAARMAGKLSAGMERFVGNILEPKVDWRDVLRRFMQKAKTDERSWARPNRRFLSQGLYLPTKSGENMGEVAFAVDCSGSIGQEEIDQFAAEIYAVKDDGQPSAIHIIYFDSSVSHYDKFERGDSDLKVKPHGGGGTAFSPVFEYMQEHNIEPEVCVFLTDLYCSDFGNAPDYPVLWVSLGADAAPFGEVVMM